MIEISILKVYKFYAYLLNIIIFLKDYLIYW
ncbi:putative membrane protein, partial [Clostridioides difficile CD129]